MKQFSLEKYLANPSRKVVTKDRLISAMLNFCPEIIGECPKCGDPIFDGYRCFGCGLDTSDKK